MAFSVIEALSSRGNPCPRQTQFGFITMQNDASDSRSPHPVDVHVGLRLRIRRKELNLSQSDLADALGLTFQQVQKYERGANRISASKLFDAARALKSPISYFFSGFGEGDSELAPSTDESAVTAFLLTSEGIEISQAFPKIKSSKLKRRILELVRTLAGATDDTTTSY